MSAVRTSFLIMGGLLGMTTPLLNSEVSCVARFVTVMKTVVPAGIVGMGVERAILPLALVVAVIDRRIARFCGMPAMTEVAEKKSSWKSTLGLELRLPKTTVLPPEGPTLLR